MKKIIDSQRTSLLKYDIRALTVVAHKLQQKGANIWAWENIGDPIAQGHQVPHWIQEAFKKVIEDNKNWGYSPTEGLYEARHFLAQETQKKGIPLLENNILFTSGLGHGINSLYQAMLGSNIRTIQPSPTYPAHSSTEAFFANSKPLFYKCDPKNNWQPDLIDVEDKIKQYPEIGFILLIAPNNPTGVCYSDEIMRGFADLARKYDLGIISDETYCQLLYTGQHQKGMAEIMMEGDPFPLIVMKSMSKDIPWPGGRCGWLEFYNLVKDKNFEELKETIHQNLRVQVCSTTMPQAVLPVIYSDKRYKEHISAFITTIEEQSQYIVSVLQDTKGITCIPAQAAFYLSAVFQEGVLQPHQTLPIFNKDAKEYVETLVSDQEMPLDKRFSLYLMASKGIFVTPLSSFEGPFGFRVTTLKTDVEETKKVYKALKEGVEEYIGS